MRPVVYSAADKDDSLRSLLEITFENHPHDSSFATTEWPKSSICVGLDGDEDGGGSNTNAGFGLDVPKMDLFAELNSDCIDKMVNNTRLIEYAEIHLRLLTLFSR